MQHRCDAPPEVVEAEKLLERSSLSSARLDHAGLDRVAVSIRELLPVVLRMSSVDKCGESTLKPLLDRC